MILWLTKLIWQNYNPPRPWIPEYMQHVEFVKAAAREYEFAKRFRKSERRETRILFLAALLQGIRITHELRQGPSSPTLDRWRAEQELDDTMTKCADHVEISSKGPSYPLSIFNGQTVAYKVARDLFADIPPHKWAKNCVKAWNRVPSCDTIKIVVEPN